MKKISKKREKELEALLDADGDEEQWDKRQLGNDARHTKLAPEEYAKTISSSVFENYPIPMVGRFWVFPQVRYVKDAEGEMGILATELARLQLGVANLPSCSRNTLTATK